MAEGNDSFLWGVKRLRLAIEAADVALWSWNLDNDRFDMDDRAFELWGVPPSATVTFEDLSIRIHPADRERVRTAFAATRGLIGAYEVDFRIVIGEEVRWISARGKGNDSELTDDHVFGIFLDVSARKQAEESNELLAGEMSHRVKNLLTIASGLSEITARSAKSAPEMAKMLSQRLVALGRAHDLTRPVPGGNKDGALLGDLLSVLLAPYDDGEIAFSGRVRVAVPRLRVGERAATALALVIHELATNSLKYGALSTATGNLDLSQNAEDEGFVLMWTERGGPSVKAPVRSSGFGSTLIGRSMARELGGSIEYDWSSDGVVIALRIDPKRLT